MKNQTKNELKKPIIIGVLLVIALIGLTILGKILPTIKWTDKYGFEHNVENNTVYTQDENAGRSYALITQLSKEDYQTLSNHELIKKIKPVLAVYSGKQYTTFDFGDGTGLTFPLSDINQPAMYGTIDEIGRVLSIEETLYVSGDSIEKVSAPATAKQESKDAINLMPEQFFNDSTMAFTIDGITYLRIFVETSQIESSAATIAQAYASFENVYLIVEDQFDQYGFVINNGALTPNNDIIATVNEKINEQIPQ